MSIYIRCVVVFFFLIQLDFKPFKVFHCSIEENIVHVVCKIVRRYFLLAATPSKKKVVYFRIYEIRTGLTKMYHHQV
jgi:hypothetical protein